MHAAAVTPEPFDPRDLRRALGRFATGVALVTAPPREALVVNAFMSVSLEPPLVALSVSHCSLTWRRMRGGAGLLGVNVLPAAVADVDRRARPGADRLAGLEVCSAPGGVPRLRDALAFLLCAPVEEHRAGDHTITICRVLDLDWDERGAPLVFFGGAYGTFGA